MPQDIQNLANDVELKLSGVERGYAERYTTAGPVNSGAGWVTVSGLSITFTLAIARRMTIMFQGQCTSNVAGTVVGTRIYNATTTFFTPTTKYIPLANFGEGLAIAHRESLGAGTHTFHIQQCQFGGSGGAYLTADKSCQWGLEFAAP